MRKTSPIMSEDEGRFMAFTGLVQWTQGVVLQEKRVIKATKKLSKSGISNSRVAALYSLHCEHHYFVIASFKLIEYREWVKKIGICSEIDFAEIDSFSRQDLKNLRDMREHVVDYFQGNGHRKPRWVVETPEYRADASSSVGTMIGGRLDYIKFTKAAKRLLSKLLKLPVPYPAQSP